MGASASPAGKPCRAQIRRCCPLIRLFGPLDGSNEGGPRVDNLLEGQMPSE